MTKSTKHKGSRSLGVYPPASQEQLPVIAARTAPQSDPSILRNISILAISMAGLIAAACNGDHQAGGSEGGMGQGGSTTIVGTGGTGLNSSSQGGNGLGGNNGGTSMGGMTNSVGGSGGTGTGGNSMDIVQGSYSNGSACLPNSSPFKLNITVAPNAQVDSKSAEIINWVMQTNGGDGWSSFNHDARIDFSLRILEADASTPAVPWIPLGGEWWDPDCSNYPALLPVGGSVEGEPNYTCNADGDCHLITCADCVPNGFCQLFETWRFSDWLPEAYYGGCQATWNLPAEYPKYLRGKSCSSADAAGYPIAPLTPTVKAMEEALAQGDNSDLGVAIRFIVDHPVIMQAKFHAPASHATFTQTTSGSPLMYGDKLRLKKDFNMMDYSKPIQVLLRTMQRYGIVLADAGHIPFTFAGTGNDPANSHVEWQTKFGIDHGSLSGVIKISDFELMTRDEVVDFGDCVRDPDAPAEPSGFGTYQ